MTTIVQSLSPAAHEKIKTSAPGLVLQIVSVKDELKRFGDLEMFKGELSDGFCKFKVLFAPATFRDKVSSYNLAIIRLDDFAGDASLIMVNEFTLLHRYSAMIGTPLNYREFQINDGNPGSTNQINKALIQNIDSQNNINKGNITPNTAQKTASAASPIQTLTARKPAQAVRVTDTRIYCDIQDLYVGLQGDWKILCRVIKANYREFQNQKGNTTRLLELVLMDKREFKIKATMFGDVAVRNRESVNVGDTYIVGGGTIKVDTYKGGNNDPKLSEYTLMLLDNSVFQPACDDGSIKGQQIGYLCVQDLKNKRAGQEVDLVVILKELKNVTEVKTKNDKVLKKRNGVVCDPENKLEIDITLWNDMVNIDSSLLHKTVILTEFRLHEYNGGLSVNSSFKSKLMPLPGHAYSKFQSRIASIPFENLSFRSDKETKVIRNIKDMQIAIEGMREDGSTWSQLRVYLNKIREKGKRDYLGCPHCKRGCSEGSTECGSCGKTFPRPQARYILSIEVSDASGSIWTTAYDEFAEKIFKKQGDFPADVVKGFSEEQFRELARKCVYQEFKLKIVSKYELLEGSRKLKHNIASVMPLDFVAEAQANIDYIRRRLNSTFQ